MSFFKPQSRDFGVRHKNQTMLRKFVNVCLAAIHTSAALQHLDS